MCLDVAEISCLNQQHQQASIFVPPVCQIKRSYSRLSLPYVYSYIAVLSGHMQGEFLLSEKCVGFGSRVEPEVCRLQHPAFPCH